MSFLDIAVVVVLASSVAGGYSLGFVTGATAWVLLVQGLVLATLALPTLDRALIGVVSPGVALAVEGVVFISGGFLGVYAGRWIGGRLRREFVPDQYRPQDRLAGAIGGPLAAIVLIWLLVIPAMSQSKGWLADEVHSSVAARAIDGVFPAAPDTSRALRRLTGPAGEPQVFASLDPFLDRVPPPAAPGLPADVVARVSASTVQVDGQACYRNRQGSGFTAAPELVVTNAHVVAGERETVVIRPDGRRLPARVVAFDSDRDLALLRVPGLNLTPLELTSPQVRGEGAVFGHPGGQANLEVSPAFVRRQVAARGADLYLEHFVRRQVLILAADLQPGDSGSALVDVKGRVMGIAFAISLDREDTAYALSTEELKPLLERENVRAVGTGDCLY